MTTHGKKMKLTVTKPKVEYTQWFELMGMQRSKLVGSQRSELESTQKSSFFFCSSQNLLVFCELVLKTWSLCFSIGLFLQWGKKMFNLLKFDRSCVNNFSFCYFMPGHVYSIQHYMIKFLNDWQQVSGFLPVPWFRPLIEWFLSNPNLFGTLFFCPE